MHPSIRQRRAILEGLRLRTALATAEFYEKVGIEAPAAYPAYRVIPKGHNAFDIIDAAGTVKAKRVGHDRACQAAQKFEYNDARRARQASAIRLLGRNMACCAAVFGMVMLGVANFA